MAQRKDERAPTDLQRSLMRDVEDRLSRIPDVPPGSGGRGLVEDWLVPALAEMFRCERFCAYRPSRLDGAWGLGDWVTGTDHAFFARYDEEMRRMSVPFCYDPLHPEPEQRNRALTLGEIHTHGPETTCVIDEMWPRMGLVGHDQLRALVCDGPTLLAWVGGFREEAFSAGERDLLNDLLRALQHSLSLRRVLLEAGLAVAGLASALEAIGAPAFVTGRDGAVTHANATGRALLDVSRSAAQERLRAALAGLGGQSSVARLEAGGLRASYLVILRDDESVLRARLVEAQRRWGVTRRELDVLRGIVAGDSNKEIALKVGLHESSVERYVTSLLRKAGCDGRSRLVARFWTM